MRVWLLLLLLGAPCFAATSPLKGTFKTLASFPELQIISTTLDSTGAIVVTGTATASGLPTTPNALQRDYRATSCLTAFPPMTQPCTDSYVARVSANGALLYGSYLGGSCNDNVAALAVDETNAIYLLGSTCSTDFPFSSPAPTSSNNSMFLVKIAADGTSGFAVALPDGVSAHQIRSAGAGEIAIGGECALTSVAWSAQFLAPKATPQTGACYIRLAANGRDIVASTVIGASLEALANDIALDAAGNAYLTGMSFPPDLPTSTRSWVSTTHQQFYDFALFAAKVSRDGKTLLGTALFNGEDYDSNPRIAISSSNDVVIAGQTQSYHFPVTPGAFQKVRLGESYEPNLFVLKLNVDLSAPVFSTYLSGEATDNLAAVWVNTDGSVTLIGDTDSTLFPTTQDGQERCLTAGYYPTAVPFLARLSADGKSLVYSSFLNQGDGGAAMASAAFLPGVTVLGLSSGNVLRLDSSQTPGPPKFCAMNAANFAGTGITPGEIVTIFGSGLSDVQIQVAGQSASVLYQSDGQVNAIVPDGVPIGGTATVAALRKGAVIDQFDRTVVNSVAGLFRDYTTPIVDATNDEGVLITTANPAKPGSIIRIWGTGFGDTHPQIRIGSTISAPVTSREANGVVEFRVLVPPIPAGQSQVTIDFTLDGTYFPGTGLFLPVVPSSQ